MDPSINSFRYPPETEEALRQCLGRTDTTTEAFLVDCERGVAAYLRTLAGDFSGGLPATIDADLQRIEHEAAQLRSSLYALPSEISALVQLHLLGAVQMQRLRRDQAALEEPLEDLAAAIHALRLQAQDEAKLSPPALRRRLLQGLGNAWRNHFNLRPVLPGEPYETVLRILLTPLAERDPEVAEWLRRPSLAGLA